MKKSLLFFFLLSANAFGVSIPKGLSVSDQEDVVKILGLGTSVKMASNPYPLGGYSGFELGLDINFINVDQLTRLGCEPGSSGCANTSRSEAQEFSYTKLTLGKGFYGDVDLFFSFSPLLKDGNFSDFGGLFRWTFYEARLLPIHMVAVVSGNHVNFKNEFASKNVATDLLVGINVEDISVYFGGGRVRSEGRFISGSGSNATVPSDSTSVNAATKTASKVVYRFHTIVGASLELKPLFIAGEINRYEDSVYTIKAGVRY